MRFRVVFSTTVRVGRLWRNRIRNRVLRSFYCGHIISQTIRRSTWNETYDPVIACWPSVIGNSSLLIWYYYIFCSGHKLLLVSVRSLLSFPRLYLRHIVGTRADQFLRLLSATISHFPNARMCSNNRLKNTYSCNIAKLFTVFSIQVITKKKSIITNNM